jgi:hypothetical protein
MKRWEEETDRRLIAWEINTAYSLKKKKKKTLLINFPEEKEEDIFKFGLLIFHDRAYI